MTLDQVSLRPDDGGYVIHEPEFWPQAETIGVMARLDDAVRPVLADRYPGQFSDRDRELLKTGVLLAAVALNTLVYRHDRPGELEP